MIRITFRFSSNELHQAIIKSAQKNHRSLNGEMERALEFYLKNSPEAKPVEKEVKAKKSKSP